MTQRMAYDVLAAGLRRQRQRKALTQQQLAEKLGLHQRQISDLERGVVDSRLSTVQNVARALDLELLLVPRELIPSVEALLRPGAAGAPMYAAGGIVDEEDDRDEAAREETR